jgi:hypothetical protein
MKLKRREKSHGSAPAPSEDPPVDRVETLLAETSDAPRPLPTAAAVTLGTLAGWDETGRPLVAFGGSPSPERTAALTTVPIAAEDVGREVAVLFVGGDAARLLIVGVIQPPKPVAPAPVMGKVEASVDGERLEFTAGREIVFRCGNASITLTKAGKVLIQGAYLLSRSSGVNRIKGGSVQIN